jgi:hypothetical protein
MMPDRVKQILSWYESDNAGTLTHLRRILGTGTLKDTGKFVILPVDQGVEHGPHRSFAPNPPGYNPHYHFELLRSGPSKPGPARSPARSRSSSSSTATSCCTTSATRFRPSPRRSSRRCGSAAPRSASRSTPAPP